MITWIVFLPQIPGSLGYRELAEHHYPESLGYRKKNHSAHSAIAGIPRKVQELIKG